MRQTRAGEARRADPGTGAFARDAALAALVLGALSGLALAAFFDPDAPYRSISAWLLAHPVAVFARNVHYWAAQIYVAAALGYGWTRGRSAPAAWRAVFMLAAGALLLLSGFVLRGDADAAEVVRIVMLLAAAIPFVEPSVAAPSTAVVYAVHVAVALVVLAPVAIALWRRRWPRRLIGIAVAAGVAAVSLFVSPGLHDGPDPLHEGPWYFVGLQRVVEWGVSPEAIVAIAAAALFAALAPAWLPPNWTARASVDRRRRGRASRHLRCRTSIARRRRRSEAALAECAWRPAGRLDLRRCRTGAR